MKWYVQLVMKKLVFDYKVERKMLNSDEITLRRKNNKAVE